MIYLYSEIGVKHNKPHIHAKYNEYELVVSADGEILAGDVFYAKRKKNYYRINLESIIMKYYYIFIIVILFSCSTQRLDTVKSMISNPEIIYELQNDTSQVDSMFFKSFPDEKSIERVIHKLQRIENNDYSIVKDRMYGDDFYFITISSNKLYHNVTFVFFKSNNKWRLSNIITRNPKNIKPVEY